MAQITDLLQLDNCELIFTDEAIRAVAELAFCKQIGEYKLLIVLDNALTSLFPPFL